MNGVAGQQYTGLSTGTWGRWDEKEVIGAPWQAGDDELWERGLVGWVRNPGVRTPSICGCKLDSPQGWLTPPRLTQGGQDSEETL